VPGGSFSPFGMAGQPRLLGVRWSLIMRVSRELKKNLDRNRRTCDSLHRASCQSPVYARWSRQAWKVAADGYTLPRCRNVRSGASRGTRHSLPGLTRLGQVRAAGNVPARSPEATWASPGSHPKHPDRPEQASKALHRGLRNVHDKELQWTHGDTHIRARSMQGKDT
jgi:hypothetical protein